MSPESPHHIKIRGWRGEPALDANKARLMRNEGNQQSVMVFMMFNEQLT